MNGREEHKHLTQTKINTTLNNLPEETREFMFGFYNSMKASKMTDSFRTHNIYINNVLKFLNQVHKKPNEIKIDDLNNYFAQNDNKSGSYLINIYSALKRFFSYMYSSGRIKEDLMVNYEKPGDAKKDQVKRYCLNTAETRDFIEAVKNGVGTTRSKLRQEKWKKRDLAIITLFLTTGIRCSALTEINVDSINFEDKENNILKVIDKGNKYLEYALSERVMDILRDWKEERSSKLHGIQCEALFISNQKKRISPSTVSDLVSKYAASITDKKISPHKLRATFGTQIYKQTKDIYYTQKCMGHSRPETTEIYVRLNNSISKEASESTSNIFGI